MRTVTEKLSFRSYKSGLRCFATLDAVSSVYNSREVELRCLERWQGAERALAPNAAASCNQSDVPKPKFRMCLPPPNVTGNLHLGHALTVSIQDVLCRWHRMHGHEVEWIPGVDHAGIATQSVVERKLMRESGRSRQAVGRDAFVKQCEAWKDERAFEIAGQLRRMGASLNYERFYYTMDAKFSNAVNKAFVRLYDDKLIFRDTRLVNHSPFLNSSVSDTEVDKLTVSEPTEIKLPNMEEHVMFGYIYHIAYPLVDSNDEIIVATTRPETLLADVAIAVNPNDARWSSFVGKAVRSILRGTALPIIADAAVDSSYHTGAVKITPGHSFVDYEIAKRHRLPLNVSCIDQSGQIKTAVGTSPSPIDVEVSSVLNGLNRFEARTQIIEILNQSGHLRRILPHSSTIPICSRSGDILEPLLKDQWFVNCNSLADMAKQLIHRGLLKIVPSFWEQVWENWHNSTQDWCISRQLWWGHRIPAYWFPKGQCWIVAQTTTEAVQMAESRLTPLDASSSHGERVQIEQDTDVLDTWFSSALVPLVCFGWPESAHSTGSSVVPTLSLMETGYDILGFWVSRMVMLCGHLEVLPFANVLLHGMIRDALGRKMSKSLGNVIDPNDIIDGKSVAELVDRIEQSGLSEDEKKTARDGVAALFPKGIQQCGADAMRLALLSQDITRQSISIDIAIAHNFRSFCNKIWQAFRYALSIWHAVPDLRVEDCSVEKLRAMQHLAWPDRWILSCLADLVDEVEVSLQEFNFHIAVAAIYDFVKLKLCDVYLEYTKPFLWSKDVLALQTISAVLYLVFENLLCVMSPFAPFICEHIFQNMNDHFVNAGMSERKSIHSKCFPSSERYSCFKDLVLREKMRTLLFFVRESAKLREGLNIPRKTKLEGLIVAKDVSTGNELLHEARALLQRLANIDVNRCVGVDHDESVRVARKVICMTDASQLSLCLHLNDVGKSAILEHLEKQLKKLKKEKLHSDRMAELRSKRFPIENSSQVNSEAKESKVPADINDKLMHCERLIAAVSLWKDD